MADERRWLIDGTGEPPRIGWSFSTDAPLAWFEVARETGEIIAADVSGGLYLLDPNGRIIAVTHGPRPVRGLAWSDTGTGGVALVGDSRLHWFSRQLEFFGVYELPDTAKAIACDAHGDYVACSLASGVNTIHDGPRKAVHRFETQRPFVKLAFIVEQPALVGVADYGLLASYSFEGEKIWDDKLFANVGDLAVNGKGNLILLACFAHGIQRYDEDGTNSGSYQLEGTPNRVACSYQTHRIAVATLEQKLYWMNPDGKVLWGATAPEEVSRLVVDPLGRALFVGFASGRLMRLEWVSY